MRHLSYAAMLLFVVLGTLPLELWLGTRVYARPKRLLLALAPVVPLFLAWDLYAVHRGQWHFDPAQTLAPRLAGLPLEEVAFFAVVPIASVLTLEAVRAARGWRVGDEG